ncbi:MBG domain-containing protein [Opitutus sp. ER46]|uniref:MBG domain-containing protein n=1 Tax=Opitutus sp. ER46 TaxID=2161864 RepID=UPI001304990B|nr:MBG domain-containing protein [Opitutus sp. ER46]
MRIPNLTARAATLLLCVLAFLSPSPSAKASETVLITPNLVTFGNADDAFSGPFNIGFTFKYCGVDYTQFYVSTNGVLYFAGADGAFSNTALTDRTGNLGVYALWDDLWITNGVTKVLYTTTGEAPNRRCILQWTNLYSYNEPYEVGTFNIVLHEETGKIEIFYRNMLGASAQRRYGTSATIGLVGTAYTTQFSLNSPVATEALQLTYTPTGVGLAPYNATTQTVTVANASSIPTYYLAYTDSPKTPVTLSANPDAGQVILSWDLSSLGQTPTGYRVRVSSDATMAGLTEYTVDAANVAGRTHTLTGLTPNGVYYWQVVSIAGTSTMVSQVASFTNKPNQSPVAASASFTTDQNTAYNGTLTATDAEGDPLIYFIVSQPRNGRLSMPDSSSGAYTYTPLTSFSGTDTITFKAFDGMAYSNLATISITVGAPVAAATFTELPVSRVRMVGQPVSFSIAATGAGPLSYQWVKDEVAISGATDTTYTIAAVAAADAGEYRCVVTNPSGPVMSAAGVLTVQPPIAWTPATLNYGTPLGAAQLNASAGITGTYAYTPAAGTQLGVGTHTLSVTFTPTDSDTYLPATTTATLTVAKAPLTVTAANASRAYGQANPALTVSYSGFVLGQTVAALTTAPTASTAATAASAVGTYPIVPAGGVAANYSFIYTSGTLTVTQAPVAVSVGPLDFVYDGTPKVTQAVTSPPNLSVRITYAGSTTAPTNAGTYVVVGTVTEANYVGSVTSRLVIARQAQTISFPAPTVRLGEPVALAATASSGLPVTYTVVSGSATISNGSLTVTGGGAVRIRATQAGNDNIEPASAELTVTAAPKQDQTITFAAPANHSSTDAPFALAATATSGLPVTFTLVSGPALLSGNQVTLSGGSGIVVVRASQAGNDTWNPAPDVVRTFTVTAVGPLVYFGRVGDTGFAASVNADGHSGTMIGTLPGSGEAFVVSFTPTADGTWTATVNTVPFGTNSVSASAERFLEITKGLSLPESEDGAADPVMGAAAATTRTFRGQLSGSVLTGTIDDLGLTFSAVLVAPAGPTAPIAGYYQSATLDSAAGAIYSIVGTQNEAYVLAITPTCVAGNVGTASADGVIAVDLGNATKVEAKVDAPTTVVTGTLTTSGGVPESFAGLAGTAVRTDRLVNLSTRSRVQAGVAELITGFVVAGSQPKTMLLRAAGPTLARLGVADAISATDLKLYDQSGQLLQAVSGWKSDARLAETFARLGAFGLSPDDRESALLVTLSPGLYTMHVVPGQGAAAAGGVALAEIYDASENPQADYQRLVNISSRGRLTSGDGVLIGGFVITGNSPKRILIRGIGPGLADLGVSGVLPNPMLAVYASGGVIARNDNWGTPVTLSAAQVAATATQITAAGTEVYAYPLRAGSCDAAVIVTLAPGTYTAMLSSADGGTGAAMIEVYEIAQ